VAITTFVPNGKKDTIGGGFLRCEGDFLGTGGINFGRRMLGLFFGVGDGD